MGDVLPLFDLNTTAAFGVLGTSPRHRNPPPHHELHTVPRLSLNTFSAPVIHNAATVPPASLPTESHVMRFVDPFSPFVTIMQRNRAIDWRPAVMPLMTCGDVQRHGFPRTY